MKLESFKKKANKKKISTLEEFKEDIFELHAEGYSLQTISDYLETKDIKTCISNISRYISRNRSTKKAQPIQDSSISKITTNTRVESSNQSDWSVKIKANNPILEELNK